ncbi:MAG: class II aldolase/adducin family protein [Betaproteobacteria bacterium]|nr:class II aldolase/adducin family protein [Betaproteobacteria bacterium]
MSANIRNLATASLRKKVSDEEWATRVDLAACYRLAAHFRMTDLIYTHISARVPGPEHHFLINAFGLLWDEISASTLVKVTLDGDIVEDPTGNGINRAGYVIHSAIHRARPDVNCVMHTHTRAGIAVSAQEDGLLPISQHAMRFWNGIAYHDYEGLALELDEQERLVRDLGSHQAMILRNHGLLVCGESIARTFDLMYYLERACQTQIAAMAGNARLRIPPAVVAEKTARQFKGLPYKPKKTEWKALLRMLDRVEPSYRD